MAKRKKLGRNLVKQVRVTSNLEKKSYSVLVQGGEGVGKTYFMGTAHNPEKDQQALIIDLEDGLLTLYKKDIPSVRIDNDMEVYNSIMEVIDLVKTGHIEKDKDGNVVLDFGKITTICIDSLWMLDYMIRSEIRDENGGDFRIQDWGTSSDRMMDIFMKAKSTGRNIIISVGESIHVDEMSLKNTADMSTVITGADKVKDYNIKGKDFKSKLGHLCDFNLVLERESIGNNVDYFAYTNIKDKREGKSRIGDLKLKIKNPTFNKVLKPVREWMDAQNNEESEEKEIG